MSENNKKSQSRLMAVQALYQASQNKKSAAGVTQEYLDHRAEDEPFDPDLFRRIVDGALRDGAALELLVDQYNAKENKGMEPLLKAIILCGVYEVKTHQDIDFPIIINDYLDIAHSFYEKGEVALVNGVLDKIRQELRA